VYTVPGIQSNEQVNVNENNILSATQAALLANPITWGLCDYFQAYFSRPETEMDLRTFHGTADSEHTQSQTNKQT